MPLKVSIHTAPLHPPSPPPQECSYVPGCMPMGVGRNTIVRKALVDKNVRIGANVSRLPVSLGFAVAACGWMGVGGLCSSCIQSGLEG